MEHQLFQPLKAELDSQQLALWFDDLLIFMKQGRMASWASVLPQQLQEALLNKEHGDQVRWFESLQKLPDIPGVNVDLTLNNLAISSDDITFEQEQSVESALRGLMPWRKGPFQFFNTSIDTEWRSDWKWQRVLPHISSLKNRVVLDVGCGSGYHLWRMLGEGALRVLGVDPSRLFLMQFQAMKYYVQAAWQKPVPADLLPFKMEEIPQDLHAFDTAFSMGVLYHRKSPLEHLQELKGALKAGGELVLETLVIEGKQGEVLMPEDRYAMMRNVWFIPSVETLLLWCRRVGFKQPVVVDINQTSLEEQRSTDWMRFNSLSDFLDSGNRNRTCEGYPAPLRAVVVAQA